VKGSNGKENGQENSKGSDSDKNWLLLSLT